MKMIRCENLCKKYGREEKYALDSLTLEVEKNSVYGFLGPNGAGKTTTIKILTGLMSQTSGNAWISGECVGKNNILLRSKIGYLGQYPSMYSWMKGQELLLFVGDIFGLSRSDNKNRSAELLDMAGLSNAANKKLSAYSGGMLQRLGIAQALMGNPEVLLLDEPTSSLDPIGRKEVLDFISSLHTNCTVFMSTHILNDVERVCDTIGIINKGKLIVEGNTEQIKRDYAPKLIEIEITDSLVRKEICDKIIALGHQATLKANTDSIAVQPIDIKKEMSSIMKLLAENSVDVSRIEQINASLEDIFVKLVGGNNGN